MTTGAIRRSAFRLRPSRWIRLAWIVPALLVAAALVVLAANGARTLPSVDDFTRSYPGVSTHPAVTPVGIPAWLAWQHGLNAFFILFVIRTGWQVRTTKRPSIFWTRTNTGWLRTKNPPIRITLDLWPADGGQRIDPGVPEASAADQGEAGAGGAAPSPEASGGSASWPDDVPTVPLVLHPIASRRQLAAD